MTAYDKAKHDALIAQAYREIQEERGASVPFAMSDLAFRRTEHLALEATWRPLRNVAADCYLQGLRDAAQAKEPPKE
jgi:hypothetical protein